MMDFQATLEHALALDKQGKVDEAVVVLDGLGGRVPDDARHQKFVGMLYQRLGADRQSYPYLKRGVELAPEDAELHLSLGFHHIDNAEIERAIKDFKVHLHHAPSSVLGWIYLGRAHDFVRDFDNGEQALRHALALEPDNFDAHIQLGRVLIRSGKLMAARHVFDAARSINPDHVMVKIGTARVQALILGDVAVTDPGTKSSPATVVCVKQGTKYGADYVNRLASMVRRRSRLKPDFVCFTEDASGLAADIRALPLPVDGLRGWWNKVALFKGDLSGVGERMLYLDLDVVITGDLDPLLTHGSDFIIMDNDYVPGFNSSVFLLKTGSRAELWDRFSAANTDAFDGDQDWVAVHAPDAELWPDGWCVPYRLRAAKAPPATAKVVCFSGRPNPAEYPAPWITDYWK